MSEKVFNEIGVIPQYDESGGRVPALPETFNPHFVATQQNFDFLEPIIQDVLVARGSSASLADKLAGVDKSIGDLNTTSAVAVSRAQERAWAESDEGFSFEMFGDSIHTWRNVADVAVTRTVEGDDSVDVESTRGLSVGSSYVIFDEGGVETIVVGEILSSTRFKATKSLTKHRTSGTLGLTNWDIKSGYAIAPAGGVFYSKPLDILRYWSDGIIVVRRDNDNGKVSISAREIGSAEWLPAEYVSSKIAADNTADVRYRIPVGGIVELRVEVEDTAIRIEHMMLLTSPQAGRAPAIEKGINLIPADGAVNQMDPLTVKASVARSLFGKDMATCTFLFYSDAEGQNLVHTGVVDTPTGEPEYTAPGGTYGENGIGSWQYYYTDIDGAVSEKSDLTGFSMSDVFQFTQTPVMIAPVADAEISANGATIVLDDMQVEPGGVGEHVASQYRLTSDAAGLVTVYDSGEVADLLSHVVSAALDRGIKLYAWARQKDAVRGWSAWVGGVPFMTEVIGHGVRVDGGVAVGPYLWVDGVVGWMIVAPGSQRVQRQWAAQYGDTGISNIQPPSPDPHTGMYNTDVIRSFAGPAFQNFQSFGFCYDLVFEGRDDFVFPNFQELTLVVENKDIIELADDTDGNTFAVIGTDYIWSSTEADENNAVIRSVNPTDYGTGSKLSSRWVVPIARQEIPVSVERVTGGVKVGPFPFADGELGFLVVAPASQRIQAAWGLYQTDVAEIDTVGNEGSPDSHTGAYNTNVLVSSSYSNITDSYGSTGSPAAKHCAGLIFEEQQDFSLPNAEELALIVANIPAIDAADDTVGTKLGDIGTGYIWSSSEATASNAWTRRPDGSRLSYNKHFTGNWVVPCRRIITGA